jgi:hypothetical protein
MNRIRAEIEAEREAEHEAEVARIRLEERRSAEEAIEAKHAVQDRARDNREAKLREQLATAQSQLDAPKRIDEGCSAQQLLAERLQSAYPLDQITVTPRCRAGADILLCVVNDRGEILISLPIEVKRARSWGATWLPKLSEDRRNSNASFAMLVSEVLPASECALPDGIYVANFESAPTIVDALRSMMLKVASIAHNNAVRDDAASPAYGYVTGDLFAQWLTAMNQAWLSEQAQLDREIRTHGRDWKIRQKAIDHGWQARNAIVADFEELGIDLG